MDMGVLDVSDLGLGLPNVELHMLHSSTDTSHSTNYRGNLNDQNKLFLKLKLIGFEKWARRPTR